ncbi:putative Suppressor of cytokine signaling 6 [Hypsibius exemplaris]|uniref:Suppressor of cytokine signaling 6 n=1 Tax=Hypsibius exemplaris TaxID=2072580 RepID=A0A1W0X893_HYPEX|nr:putative Suppressor of cytokine signaling 6 [Hypsibius exemplaris]
MKTSLRLPFRRTKSNAEYEESSNRPLPADENHISHTERSPTATEKHGFFKTIQSKIRRQSLRGGDDSDHGFLLPGPRRGNFSSPLREVAPEIEQALQERPSTLTLRDRRSVNGGPLTIARVDEAFGGTPSWNGWEDSSKRTQKSPAVPERSPVSLGLQSPSVTSSPKSRKVSALRPPTTYEMPRTFGELSPASPMARDKDFIPSCLTKPLRALPPIPAQSLEDCLDLPPAEEAPAPPPSANLHSSDLLYRPPHENFSVTAELHQLSHRGWYWGPISRSDAEAKLSDRPDGTFLVRNSLDPRHILSLSFRSLGQTLHARIEYNRGRFSFYPQLNEDTYPSVVALVESAMENASVSYSRSRDANSPTFPVRLQFPISRFAQVMTLQALCRFTVRLHIRYDHLEGMALPGTIRRFLAFPQLNA